MHRPSPSANAQRTSFFLLGPPHAKTCLQAYGDSQGPDPPDQGLHCPLICVEVLRPSQPNGVMSSAVSLPNHTFTGQA